MIDESSLLPDVYLPQSGFLNTPVNMDIIKNLTDFDEWTQQHSRTLWDEYSISGYEVYPYFLTELAKLGLAFGWEYEHTEGMYHFAYNFPTEDKPINLVHYSSVGRRKTLPYLTRKMRKQIESTSAANELLYQLGIKNGSN